jgi:hypothetical protein
VPANPDESGHTRRFRATFGMERSGDGARST